MSHMAVYNLSMPTHLRTMGVDDFNIDPTKMEESKKAAALESQSNEDDMDDVDDSMGWKPFLEHQPALGVDSAHKIQWPTMAQLMMCNLTK